MASPQLSREEMLAIWLEGKRKKKKSGDNSVGSRISSSSRISNASGAGNNSLVSTYSTPNLSHRRWSNRSSASLETSSVTSNTTVPKPTSRGGVRGDGTGRQTPSPCISTSREMLSVTSNATATKTTPFEKHHVESFAGRTPSPYLSTSHVSCRQHRLPERKTVPLRKKQIPSSERKGIVISSRQPLSTLTRDSAGMYPTRQPSQAIGPKDAESKAELSASNDQRFNQVNHVSNNDDNDTWRKSRDLKYLFTPNENLRPSNHSSHDHVESQLDGRVDKENFIDLNVVMKMQELMSPLSVTSLPPSPASTISSNHIGTPIVSEGEYLMKVQNVTTPRDAPSSEPGYGSKLKGSNDDMTRCEVALATENNDELLQSPAPSRHMQQPLDLRGNDDDESFDKRNDSTDEILTSNYHTDSSFLLLPKPALSAADSEAGENAVANSHVIGSSEEVILRNRDANTVDHADSKPTIELALVGDSTTSTRILDFSSTEGDNSETGLGFNSHGARLGHGHDANTTLETNPASDEGFKFTKKQKHFIARLSVMDVETEPDTTTPRATPPGEQTLEAESHGNDNDSVSGSDAVDQSDAIDEIFRMIAPGGDIQSRLDFRGLDDDDSLDWRNRSPDEILKCENRRKRRTDSSFILLPKPELSLLESESGNDCPEGQMIGSSGDMVQDESDVNAIECPGRAVQSCTSRQTSCKDSTGDDDSVTGLSICDLDAREVRGLNDRAIVESILGTARFSVRDELTKHSVIAPQNGPPSYPVSADNDCDNATRRITTDKNDEIIRSAVVSGHAQTMLDLWDVDDDEGVDRIVTSPGAILKRKSRRKRRTDSSFLLLPKPALSPMEPEAEPGMNGYTNTQMIGPLEDVKPEIGDVKYADRPSLLSTQITFYDSMKNDDSEIALGPQNPGPRTVHEHNEKTFLQTTPSDVRPSGLDDVTEPDVKAPRDAPWSQPTSGSQSDDSDNNNVTKREAVLAIDESEEIMRSALSRHQQPTLDLRGVDDDECFDLPGEILKCKYRRKRRTDSSFLLLPKPELSPMESESGENECTGSQLIESSEEAIVRGGDTDEHADSKHMIRRARLGAQTMSTQIPDSDFIGDESASGLTIRRHGIEEGIIEAVPNSADGCNCTKDLSSYRLDITASIEPDDIVPRDASPSEPRSGSKSDHSADMTRCEAAIAIDENDEIVPSAARSRYAQQTLDIWDVDDGECLDSPGEILKCKHRRKRRTGSSFLLLPNAALSPMESESGENKRKGSHMVESSEDAMVIDFNRIEQADSKRTVELERLAECTISTQIADSDSIQDIDAETALSICSHGALVQKLSEKAILETIPESVEGYKITREGSHKRVHSASVGSTGVQESMQANANLMEENVALRAEINGLRLDKKKLEDKLHLMRRSYEERVTPFRDLFEERRKLRFDHQRLTNEKMEALGSVQKMVDDLKLQLITGLTSAVAKTQQLQQQLDEVKAERDGFKQALAKFETWNPNDVMD